MRLHLFATAATVLAGPGRALEAARCAGIEISGRLVLQRSEGGALGIGGGSMGGMMTARGSANFIQRATWWLGGAFMALSLLLAVLGGIHGEPRSFIDQAPPPAGSEPAQPTTPHSATAGCDSSASSTSGPAML